MPSPTAQALLQAFIKLGRILAHPGDMLSAAMESATYSNAWFTPEMISKSIEGLAVMLQEDDLTQWLRDIKIAEHPKKVGLILAGNIPLVGFHDILCVLATGNIALIKLSSADEKLLPAILDQLILLEPSLSGRIVYTERLKDFDAVIATGSNNSSRYFEYYFGKVPHIIRKNRNSVAVLTGNESPAALARLGNDIFDFFGLGCRNVSKIFIPEGYDIKSFFEPVESFQPIIHHFKYNNNYDYNKSVYLVNRVKHYDNGFLLLKEDEGFSSPLAVLFFQQYKILQEAECIINEQSDSIQCVASEAELAINKAVVPFGQTQQPRVWDYADDVNTVEFLSSL